MERKKNESKRIIEINSLTKRFGSNTAVDNISFNVDEGEIFAFLGPNGAGKSTTIKMLITLLSPTSGGGKIDNVDFVLQAAEVRRKIGYVPQMISVDGTLTAYENLMLMARLYDIPYGERRRRIDEMFIFLDLKKNSHSLVRTFSGGMIRKLEIGQALLHSPKVLFLDEPTAGLDPIAKQNVWGHLLELNKKFGTTIFFSTHNMEEAEEVSDRVAIINQGRIVAIGNVRELKNRTKIRKATLQDVFIYFTGNKMEDKGNLYAIKQTRQILHRRG